MCNFESEVICFILRNKNIDSSEDCLQKLCSESKRFFFKAQKWPLLGFIFLFKINFTQQICKKMEGGGEEDRCYLINWFQ